MLSDSHIHLDAPVFRGKIPAVIKRARQAGVGHIVTIGVTPASSRNCIRIAEQFPGVYATAGYHPHWAQGASPDRLAEMEKLAAMPAAVAVGEIGLDYHHLHSPRQYQLKLFDTMLEIAVTVARPVVIHDRQAHGDVYRLLCDFQSRLAGGVIHCFSGDWQLARKYLDRDFYLSIPGTVTYPSAHALKDVARRAPLNRLLIETDAPHLTPFQCKGRPNEPAFIHHTAKAVARLRKLPLADVARATSRNLRRIFALPSPTADNSSL